MPRPITAALATLPLLLALAGCESYSVQHYSTFDVAMEMEPTREDPPILHRNSLPNDLPHLVVYARVHGDFHGEYASVHAVLLKRVAEEKKLTADVLIYSPEGSKFVFTGFGSYVPRPQGSAYCYRLSPIGLGFQWNANQMVTSVTDATHQQSGLQEGDTLVSLNGHAVTATTSPVLPYHAEMLRLRPGDPVKMVWIRPGTGRMEGVFEAGEPRPLPSDLQSFYKSPDQAN